MRWNLPLKALLLAACLAASPAPAAPADAELAIEPQLPGGASPKIASTGLELVGTLYRRGGTGVETGFDCSGFVLHVYQEAAGVELPRTSREMSHTGKAVHKTDLEPGDLVFFNTLKRAFSHVGIYLGDHLFVHAPRPGHRVRVEDLREPYWTKRYNGARRVRH